MTSVDRFRGKQNLQSRAKAALTRSFGAASPATERARRVIGGAERDIPTPRCIGTLNFILSLRIGEEMRANSAR